MTGEKPSGFHVDLKKATIHSVLLVLYVLGHLGFDFSPINAAPSSDKIIPNCPKDFDPSLLDGIVEFDEVARLKYYQDDQGKSQVINILPDGERGHVDLDEYGKLKKGNKIDKVGPVRCKIESQSVIRVYYHDKTSRASKQHKNIRLPNGKMG